MGILLTILSLYLFFMLTGLLFRIAGSIAGAVLSLMGYAVIGMIAISLFSMTMYALPLVLLVGLGATAARAIRA
ncbi:MAG: hypothetical protein MR488_10965 [Lachnospiraceae bacterium]|nr:hypothetical protein [Lachnospiraceae bacterium]